MKIWLIGALLVAAAALGAAACGDDDDSSSDNDVGSPRERSDESFAGGDDSLADVEEAIAESSDFDGDAESAPAESSGGEEGQPAGLGLAPLDRKIIESATISVEVEEVVRSFSTISRIATTSGGFVAESNVYVEDDERYATITIRVPAGEYTSALEQIRALGEVVSEGSDASDVTEEYTDLESRLRNLQAVEAQYVELLGQATTINDILVVQDRLNITRSEIEQVQGRINVLDDLTELATIDVFLSPPVDPVVEGEGGGGGFFGPAEAAVGNSLEGLRDLSSGALAAGIYGLWLLPVALVVLAGVRILQLVNRARPA